MIEVLSVRSELDRLDEMNRQTFCAEHANVPEARCSRWRLAFEKAAAKGQASFMRCDNCCVPWLPERDVNYAVRYWIMIISDDRCAAVLCPVCAANPDPVRLPHIARLILWQSRGPLQ